MQHTITWSRHSVSLCHENTVSQFNQTNKFDNHEIVYTKPNSQLFVYYLKHKAPYFISPYYVALYNFFLNRLDQSIKSTGKDIIKQ